MLENNRKAHKVHYKRKLEKLGITNYDYKSVQEYIKNEIQCNDSEVDEILEDSVHSGIDLSNNSRWVLLTVFSRNNKIHIDEVKKKYQQPKIYIPKHNDSNNDNSSNSNTTYSYKMVESDYDDNYDNYIN